MTNLTTMIDFIAARTTRRAASAARRGVEQHGLNIQFGTLNQRAMGIEWPTKVTPAHRQAVADELTRRGFAVRTNTKTDLRGRTTFFSFTVTAI